MRTRPASLGRFASAPGLRLLRHASLAEGRFAREGDVGAADPGNSHSRGRSVRSLRFPTLRPPDFRHWRRRAPVPQTLPEGFHPSDSLPRFAPVLTGCLAPFLPFGEKRHSLSNKPFLPRRGRKDEPILSMIAWFFNQIKTRF